MIEINGLIKRYGDRTVLDVPFLKIEDGAAVAFAGANGSGKTTLLRILAGIIKASEGSISKPAEILFMPQQSYAFKGDLIRNVTIGGADKDRARELLERLELSRLSGKQASSLSGGELQRLALCRVLSKECRLLLLDEPTSACDAKGAELVAKAIAEYRDRTGCTVLFSTHSPSLALNSAERLIVFSDGRIDADGPPGDIMRDPETEWAKSFIAGWKTGC